MTWLSSQKARMDEAVARLHAENGETVYVRRFLSTQPDLIYQEDLTRTEEVFRVIGVVQRNPNRRVLERHGRDLPVDLLVTFDFDPDLPNETLIRR